MASLVFLNGDEAGRFVGVSQPRPVFSIGDGSVAGTDIVITGRGVDPTHAMLERVGGEFWLQCVAGPTWVDHVEQRPGSRVRLQLGDRLTIGLVSLKLCEDSEVPELAALHAGARGGHGRIDPMTLLQRPQVFWAGLGAVAADGARVSLALIDMDHWKRVNDLHGMTAGDQVLQWAALQLEKHALPQEVLGRVGGTRFALRMRDLGPAAALERAATLLEALARQPYVLEGKPLAVTASAGCATLQLDGATVAEVVRAAEERLDQAKATSRGRAVGRANGQRFDKPPGAS